MGSTDKTWQEKEWERYVNQLLATHHAIFGGSYQPVPDLGGDHGLEGFTTDTGEAYQAYADQNSKNNQERTRKQKKKISEDLAKLEKYRDFWEKMLDETRLKQWTLLVPDVTFQSLETDEAFDSRQPNQRLGETRVEFEAKGPSQNKLPNCCWWYWCT